MYIVIFYCRTPWLVVVEFFPQYMYRPGRRPSTASSDFIFNNRRWLLYSASGDVSMVDCCILVHLVMSRWLNVVSPSSIFSLPTPVIHRYRRITFIAGLYTLQIRPVSANSKGVSRQLLCMFYAICSGAPHNTMSLLF